MTTVHGVDGARGGWAVAAATFAGGGRNGGRNGGRITALRWHRVAGQDAAGLGRIMADARADGVAAIGIDCPVGLPSDGWRAVDLEARRWLGRAAARVFLAPPRPVFQAPSYAQARAVAADLLGRQIPAQTYGIRGIVLAVDGALSGPGAGWARRRMVEAHPELSFMAMTGRASGDALPAKRTPAGRSARVAALTGLLAEGVRLDPPGGDDHLDALAVAWSAWRWTVGAALVLGGDLDRHGLPMRIVV